MLNGTSMAEAPRLLHYWGRTEGADILSMRRSEFKTWSGMMARPSPSMFAQHLCEAFQR